MHTLIIGKEQITGSSSQLGAVSDTERQRETSQFSTLSDQTDSYSDHKHTFHCASAVSLLTLPCPKVPPAACHQHSHKTKLAETYWHVHFQSRKTSRCEYRRDRKAAVYQGLLTHISCAIKKQCRNKYLQKPGTCDSFYSFKENLTAG